MKTKNFFFAALLLSAVSTSCLTSCQDDDADDFNHMPDYHQTTSKDMKTTVRVTDMALKLYDIKVTYTCNGKAVEEVLDESKFSIAGTDTVAFFERRNYYDFRQCTLSKHFGNQHVDIVITATPKANALSVVEGMEEDQKDDVVIKSSISGYNVIDGNSSNNLQQHLGFKKNTLTRLLSRGELMIQNLSCK